MMSNITTIVKFSVPRENVDEHLANWRKIEELVIKQPGAWHGTFYRSIDDDSPFQFGVTRD
jgi:hypothetical protein